MAPTTTGNGTLILEEPLIRTPYELLRRSHRSAQRQVEKDFIAVQSTLNGLLKSFEGDGDPDESRKNAIAKLDQAGERVRGLKRKLDDLQPSMTTPTALRHRLTYLDQLSNPPTDAPSGGIGTGTEAEGDKTLDRYIVDYLLRTGRLGSAKALAEKKNIENLVDIKLFAELVRIEEALINKHSIVEALAWCGENRGTLKKTKNNLEFTLRLQEFIELCRMRDTVNAIAYSRKNLAAWAPTHMHELQQGMTLLAFGDRTGVGLYRKLYDQDRWVQVRNHFRETFLSLYALPSQPLLSLALSAGLSTLRLPSCVPYQTPAKISPLSPRSPVIPLLPAAPPLHNLEDALFIISSGGGDSSFHLSATNARIHNHNHSASASDTNHDNCEMDLKQHPDAAVGNVDCPTCGQDMKVLANEVPMSHHVNSTLVCRISGQVMDSQNPPLAFPNGYVYSTNALAQMAKTNYDVVTCPRTRETCSLPRLRKVYIS